MKDGLYSARLKGFDGLELPLGGVLVLRNGMMLGGGSYSYFTGSYSAKNGIFKGELVFNQHTPPPSNHVLFNGNDVGMGISGTYEGDQAELTGTVVVGKRCLTLQVTLLRLTDLRGNRVTHN
jgi:T3SS negative regulator,GrlR